MDHSHRFEAFAEEEEHPCISIGKEREFAVNETKARFFAVP